MVHGKLALDAVDNLQLGELHNAGIQDQHVDRHTHVGDALRGRDDARQVRQFDSERRRLALHFGTGLLGLFERARRADHVRPAHCEHAQGLVTEPGVAARYERRLAGQVHARGHCLGRAAFAKRRGGRYRRAGDGRPVAVEVGLRGHRQRGDRGGDAGLEYGAPGYSVCHVCSSCCSND